MVPLHTQVEALLFCSPRPLSKEELVHLLSKKKDENENGSEHKRKRSDMGKQIAEAVEKLQRRYEHGDYAFCLCHVGGGYQFLTKPSLSSILSSFLKHHTRRRLSKACLETLSIVAYTQPATRADIEQLRGVSSDYALQRLIEKELVRVQGRKPTTQALLYGTTKTFMNRFGLNSLKELPELPVAKSSDP